MVRSLFSLFIVALAALHCVASAQDLLASQGQQLRARSLQNGGDCELIDADFEEIEGEGTICEFLELLISFGKQNNALHSVFNMCCKNLSGDSEPECCRCIDEDDPTNNKWKKIKPDGSCPTQGRSVKLPKDMFKQGP